MSNKADNSGNMCSKIFTKTARDAKGAIKTGKGEKKRTWRSHSYFMPTEMSPG